MSFDIIGDIHGPAGALMAHFIVEIPVQKVTGDGQIVMGRMDLLINTAESWVLVDHKSAAGIREYSEAKLVEYVGQLSTYRGALLGAKGKDVEASWIAMPIAGKAIRIDSGEVNFNMGNICNNPVDCRPPQVPNSVDRS